MQKKKRTQGQTSSTAEHCCRPLSPLPPPVAATTTTSLPTANVLPQARSPRFAQLLLPHNSLGDRLPFLRTAAALRCSDWLSDALCRAGSRVSRSGNSGLATCFLRSQRHNNDEIGRWEGPRVKQGI